MSDFCAQRQEEGNNNITLGDFLSEVSLLTDQDSDKDGDDEKITLMTVHSAKGLEFRNVLWWAWKRTCFPAVWWATLPGRWKKNGVCSTWPSLVRKTTASLPMPRAATAMAKWNLEVPAAFEGY